MYGPAIRSLLTVIVGGMMKTHVLITFHFLLSYKELDHM